MKYKVGDADWVDVTGTTTSANLPISGPCTIQVVKKATDGMHVDSDSQTIPITRPTPTYNVTQPAVINGKGKVAATGKHQYKKTDATEWTDFTDEVSLAPGSYQFRKPYSGTELTSEAQTIEIIEYLGSPEATPTDVSFEATGYDSGLIKGLKKGMAYKVNTDQWTPINENGDVRISEGLVPCTIAVKRMGNGSTTMDSDEVTFTVSRAATPSNLTTSYPTTIGGSDGAINGTTTAMEYKKDDASVTTWTTCSAQSTSRPAGTYLVRTKANGTQLASENASVTISDPTKETKPNATFAATGADTGTLRGLINGGAYEITGAAKASITSAQGDVSLTGVTTGDLSIVKKGNGSSTVDSDAHTITIYREPTPTVTGEDAAPSSVKGKLKVTEAATTDKFEYKQADANSWDGATEFTGAETAVTPGTYVVRKLATETNLTSNPSNQVSIKGKLPKPSNISFTATDKDKGQLSGTGLNINQTYEISGTAVGTARQITPTSIPFTLNDISIGDFYMKAVGDGTNTTDSDKAMIAYITQAAAPQSTAVSATDCTTADNNDGKLSGVSNTMEYSTNGTNWTDGTGNAITGLAAGTYYVRTKATGTDLASTNLELTIKGKEATPEADFTATSESTGTLSGVSSGMKYKVGSAESWTDITGTSVSLTGLSKDTVIKVKKPAGSNTVESDEWSITLTQATTPSAPAAVDCTSSANNNGTLIGVDDTMEYQKSGATSWTPVESNSTTVTGLENGTYYVRVKAAGAELASGNQTLTIRGKEATPEATFTATGPDTGTLSGVESGMKYTTDGTKWTDISSNDDINLTGLSACTIQVVKKGNTTTTIDSDPKTITITKAEIPNLQHSKPKAIGGKVSIPTTTAHQKSANGTDWENCTGAWNGLTAGKTYYVRVKAAGTVLASDAQDITINAFPGTPEATPSNVGFTATGADTGKLTGLENGAEYALTGAEPDSFTASGTEQAITDVSAGDLSLVKKGNGETTTDSDALSITVQKEATPSAAAADCTKADNNDGKITGVTASMEWKKSDDSDWTTVSGTEISGLTPGTYYVRAKAGAKLASDNQTLKVKAHAAENQAEAPFFETAAGTFAGEQTVRLDVPTDGDVYYTTDGSDPTDESNTSRKLYKAAEGISLSSTTTIKAVAVKSDKANSAIVTATYTIEAATYQLEVTAPKFSSAMVGYAQPDAKAIAIKNTGNSDVTITSVALDATGANNFTLNPMAGKTVNAGKTDKTYTIQPNAGLATGTYPATITVTYDDKSVTPATSKTATATVSFKVLAQEPAATPKISPNGGSFTDSTKVKITCKDENTDIYYTTDDGSTPTKSSTKYTGEFTVSSSCTVKAIAVADGMADSEIAEASFTITQSSNPGTNPGTNPGSGTHTHTYGAPVWTWSDDYKSAKATFECSNKDDTVIAPATVKETIVTAATCDAEGKATYTATVSFNNKSYTDSKTVTLKKLEHEWTEEIIKPATCKEKGEKKLTCKLCKTTKTEEIPVDANAHVWDEGVVTKEATETEEGEKLFTCTVCGATKTEVIPKTSGGGESHVVPDGLPAIGSSSELGKPKVKSVTNTAKGVEVKFSTVKGATGYYVFENGKFMGKVDASKAKDGVITYLDKKATGNGKSYKYEIVAYNESGAGALSKAKTTTFVTKPAAPTLKKGKKKITVKWKRNKKASGYQIQCATDKKFKKNLKKSTIKKNKTVKTTVKKLKAKKKYFVRMRTFKTVNGKKVYSAWSKTKTVKTK